MSGADEIVRPRAGTVYRVAWTLYRNDTNNTMTAIRVIRATVLP